MHKNGAAEQPQMPNTHQHDWLACRQTVAEHLPPKRVPHMPRPDLRLEEKHRFPLMTNFDSEASDRPLSARPIPEPCRLVDRCRRHGPSGTSWHNCAPLPAVRQLALIGGSILVGLLMARQRFRAPQPMQFWRSGGGLIASTCCDVYCRFKKQGGHSAYAICRTKAARLALHSIMDLLGRLHLILHAIHRSKV